MDVWAIYIRSRFLIPNRGSRVGGDCCLTKKDGKPCVGWTSLIDVASEKELLMRKVVERIRLPVASGSGEHCLGS